MKVLVQVLEIGIWLTIAFFLGRGFKMVIDSWMFEEFSPVFDNLVYLFWFNYTSILVYILSWVLIVMFGRWVNIPVILLIRI